MPEKNIAKRNRFIHLLFAVMIALMCFFLGYVVYYLYAGGQFLTTTLSQHFPIQNRSKATALPNQTNLLLLGSDNDQKFTGNPLTQTMMVVHIDYTKKTVVMFSIPRDLWVRMPDKQNYGKIDQAAEYQGIPSAVKVVEQTFGIPIDHYGWVGLYGFIKSIDAVGGINLQAVHPVLDNAYPTDINSTNPYGYQRLNIQPGMQHMTGEQALQYVRSRHEDLIGDFGRTQRQRQLLLALKDLLFSSQTSFFALPSIFTSLEGQVKTDVTPSFALQLGTFFFLNKESIRVSQVTLAPPLYSSVGTTTDGQSVVIGDASHSANLIGSIFGNNAGQITLQSLTNIPDIAQ